MGQVALNDAPASTSRWDAADYARIGGFVPALGQHMALSTIALIWFVTAINWRGARAAGQFQLVTLLIKLIPLVTVIILIPIAFGRSEPVSLTPFPADGLSLAAVSGSAITARRA